MAGTVNARRIPRTAHARMMARACWDAWAWAWGACLIITATFFAALGFVTLLGLR